MARKEHVWRRWLRGVLDNLLEKTEGGTDELRGLMRKLDEGKISWTGRKPG